MIVVAEALTLQTNHGYSDSGIDWIQTLTIQNAGAGIVVDDVGITEDVTDSLPSVPFQYFQLPFENCRLYDISMYQDDSSLLCLYLTVKEIGNEESPNEIILSVEIGTEDTYFHQVNSFPKAAMQAGEFVKSQSSYDIEVLNQHLKSNKIEALITGKTTKNEMEGILRHKTSDEKDELHHQVHEAAGKTKVLFSDVRLRTCIRFFHSLSGFCSPFPMVRYSFLCNGLLISFISYLIAELSNTFNRNRFPVLFITVDG